jgi:hypothetical protein
MRNHKLFVTADGADSSAPLTEGVVVESTDTYYSKMFSGNEGKDFHIHLEWTGDPTGALSLWYSSKPNPVETDDDDWTEDAGWAPTDPAGAPGKTSTDTTGKSALRKRIKYVNASGTGVLKGWVSVPNV